MSEDGSQETRVEFRGAGFEETAEQIDVIDVEEMSEEEGSE
jgi:hypothetical protein